MVIRPFSWAFEDKKRPSKDRRSRQSQAARSERGHVARYQVKAEQRLSAAKGVESLIRESRLRAARSSSASLRGEAEGVEVGQDIGVERARGSCKRVDVIA